MTILDVSLSRTHKIAERLKTRATELLAEALALSQPVSVTGTGTAQGQRLAAQGQRALDRSEQGQRYLRAGAQVRTVIAKANDARGINDLLAQLDAVNRLVTHHKSLLEQCKQSGISAEELESFQPLSSQSLHYGITVNVMANDIRTKVEAQLATLQREAFQLADRIAEANAGRLTLELDDDIAAEVTGG